jgi:hypothetical protein
MATIILEQRIIICAPYAGVSKFDLFKNLQVGDIIEITSPLVRDGEYRGVMRHQMVKLVNTRTLDEFSDNVNVVLSRLRKCKYDQYYHS